MVTFFRNRAHLSSPHKKRVRISQGGSGHFIEEDYPVLRVLDVFPFAARASSGEWGPAPPKTYGQRDGRLDMQLLFWETTERLEYG